MVGLIKVIGKMVKCMGKGYIYGKMEENIKVITIMIKNMEMEDITGLMGKCFRGPGLMVKDKVRV